MNPKSDPGPCLQAEAPGGALFLFLNHTGV